MFVPRFHCALRSPPSSISSIRYPVLVANRRAMATHNKLRSYLVSPAELHSALKLNASRLSHEPRIIPLCASWFLPNDGRNGYETFLTQHIPHSQFFDLDAVKDEHSPYPHMLPSASDFAVAMRHLGIRREDNVVVYDTKELGIFSAPRVGWTLQVFGHPKVHVLNNFRKWVEEGYPTESGEPKTPKVTEYEVPQLDESKVAAFEQVKEIAKELGKEGADEVQILDARSLGRWKGVDPEPREGLSSGHIPHSISVPVADLLDPKDKTFLPASELKAVFESKGIKAEVPIISSCGTGVTAAIIDAALTEAGYPTQQRRLYDGSWTEWAQRVKPGEGLIHKTE